MSTGVKIVKERGEKERGRGERERGRERKNREDKHRERDGVCVSGDLPLRMLLIGEKRSN